MADETWKIHGGYLIYKLSLGCVGDESIKIAEVSFFFILKFIEIGFSKYALTIAMRDAGASFPANQLPAAGNVFLLGKQSQSPWSNICRVIRFPKCKRLCRFRSNRYGLTNEDLNRRWSNPNPVLHPVIYHAKGLMEYCSKVLINPPYVFVDYHGHSRRKNVFLFGCSKSESWSPTDRNQPDEPFKYLVSRDFFANYVRYESGVEFEYVLGIFGDFVTVKMFETLGFCKNYVCDFEIKLVWEYFDNFIKSYRLKLMLGIF